jgi:hypothetical protein
MTDISPLLYFYFWQPVYFLVDESEQHFPGKSKELRGRWVGITDDTGEEVCRSAIRLALDPTMKNLREDPIEIEKDPISLEDILSPAEAISTKIKSDAMNDKQGLYFCKPSTETMEDQQGSHFKQTSSPTPSTTAPKRNSTNKKQRHERVPKLRDLHQKDPTKVPHRYPKEVIIPSKVDKLSQLLMMILMTLPIACLQKMPIAYLQKMLIMRMILILLTRPPTQQHLQQSFGNSSSRPVTPISPNSPIHLSIYLRDNGENENPIWKRFEVTLQEGNGNVKLGPDGKPMIAIAPPPSDLCGRVFLTKPDDRGEVKRARALELIKDFEGNVAKNKDLIKFKLKYDHNDFEDVMS